MPLFVVPTPIGNLMDMTLRAIEVLKTSDLLLCEDTRRAIKLLNYYNIKVKMLSYHEHNEKSRLCEVLGMLDRGIKVALISDAGTPCISDPGQLLICEAIKAGHEVDALPGPSAILPALVMSGLPSSQFSFLGFLPEEKASRQRFLISLRNLPHTSLFYVAPHKLKRDLEDIIEIWGDRKAALVREISKIHQECLRGFLSDILGGSREVRGEITLVVDGLRDTAIEEEDKSWQKVAVNMRKEGMAIKDIAKILSESYGIEKNRVRKFVLGRERMEEGRDESRE